MFQFPRLPPLRLCIQRRADTALPVPGFPIRESAGQSLFSSSPRLIAAVHALHRLLVPRHPPCALTILTVIVDSRATTEGRIADVISTVIFPLFGQLCSFQGPARAQPRGLPGWSLKTQQCTRRRSKARRAPGPVDVLGTPRGHEAAGRRASFERLPRKEVIQPHLPVRLPCYDFTPITSPTFDGSLPKGWVTGFGCCPLSWCDGRCVQGPGTYSPRRC